MKRNPEKSGNYDHDNAKALIIRILKTITSRSITELTISYTDFSYKVILDNKNVFIARPLFDTYYKCYSDKTQREYVINQIKNKLQSLVEENGGS